MRNVYHDELDAIGHSLVQMTNQVALAMQRATNALLDGDLALAERVISDDEQVDNLRHELEDRAFLILAQQQPVATDLRVIVSSIHLTADIERMGDLALHIAKIARMRYPDLAVPDDARDVISQMGTVALSLVHKVALVIEGRDLELAKAIEIEDDSMDALRRKLFAVILSPHWDKGTESAIDLALLGRYYERYADHAVGVARRVIFIVTGKRPEPVTTGFGLLG